jgi:photosystem II stability/assembly factor-like uncharacterized protein
LAAGLGVLAAVGVGAYLLLGGEEGGSAPSAWATLGTADVHSLAFAPPDPSHLYFGHHDGLLESRDGGRSWQPGALSGADAMNVRPGGGDLMQIAGHEVYLESRDGGQTWEPVPNDLPGLDLHAFVVDPRDAEHAWAFAVGHGLFETTDAGRHWELRAPGNIGALTVFVEDGRAVLVGLSQAGLGRSDDGGGTWQPLTPPEGQLVSLAAAEDGSVLYAGTTAGLLRSTDGGGAWSATPLEVVPLTIAVAPSDPSIVAVVDEATRFYRSEDAGATWPGPG